MYTFYTYTHVYADAPKKTDAYTYTCTCTYTSSYIKNTFMIWWSGGQRDWAIKRCFRKALRGTSVGDPQKHVLLLRHVWPKTKIRSAASNSRTVAP